MWMRAFCLAGVLAIGGTAWVGGAARAAPPNAFLDQRMLAEATIGSAPPVSRVAPSLDGFTPAPMPDLDRSAPAAAPDARAARVSPKLFHRQSIYRGEGYVFGSTVQEEQERRATPGPGINLIMPLQ